MKDIKDYIQQIDEAKQYFYKSNDLLIYGVIMK